MFRNILRYRFKKDGVLWLLIMSAAMLMIILMIKSCGFEDYYGSYEKMDVFGKSSSLCEYSDINKEARDEDINSRPLSVNRTIKTLPEEYIVDAHHTDHGYEKIFDRAACDRSIYFILAFVIIIYACMFSGKLYKTDYRDIFAVFPIKLNSLYRYEIYVQTIFIAMLTSGWSICSLATSKIDGSQVVIRSIVLMIGRTLVLELLMVWVMFLATVIRRKWVLFISSVVSVCGLNIMILVIHSMNTYSYLAAVIWSGIDKLIDVCDVGWNYCDYTNIPFVYLLVKIGLCVMLGVLAYLFIRLAERNYIKSDSEGKNVFRCSKARSSFVFIIILTIFTFVMVIISELCYEHIRCANRKNDPNGGGEKNIYIYNYYSKQEMDPNLAYVRYADGPINEFTEGTCEALIVFGIYIAINVGSAVAIHMASNENEWD